MTNEVPRFGNKENGFSEAQLVKFQGELFHAGSFDQLMIIKEAIKEDELMPWVYSIDDMVEYKAKHWVGAYTDPYGKPLITRVPYEYWRELYEAGLE